MQGRLGAVSACLSVGLMGLISAAPVQAERLQRNAQTGTASWYGPGFHGKATASGARFDQQAMTAAHRELPLGTMVRVVNLRNNRAVVVQINDRGPMRSGRVIDLSRGAARALDMVGAGLAKVRLEVVSAKREVEPEAPRARLNISQSIPIF